MLKSRWEFCDLDYNVLYSFLDNLKIAFYTKMKTIWHSLKLSVSLHCLYVLLKGNDKIMIALFQAIFKMIGTTWEPKKQVCFIFYHHTLMAEHLKLTTSHHIIWADLQNNTFITREHLLPVYLTIIRIFHAFHQRRLEHHMQ